MPYKILYSKGGTPPISTVKDTLDDALTFAANARERGGYSVDIWELTADGARLLREYSDTASRMGRPLKFDVGRRKYSIYLNPETVRKLDALVYERKARVPNYSRSDIFDAALTEYLANHS